MPRKLLPMVTALLLCGAATAALIVTNANAASSAKTAAPIMVALADGPDSMMATPPDDAGGGPPPGMPGMEKRRAAMCGELSARTAGRLAYLEARLDLTAAQKPLFDRWKGVKQSAADRRQDQCEARKPMRQAKGENPMRPSAVDRLSREEDHLQQRLADIRAERPALGALYASLSDDQKTAFDRGGRHRMMHSPMGGQRPRHGRDHMPPLPADAPPPPQ